jgi:UDP-glucose:(heptosyl)LPS alpha-1,3-glucosyltransferase
MQNNSHREIALVRSSYSPYGGAERLTLDLIQAMLKEDIRVFLLTHPHQDWPVDHPKFRRVQLGFHRGNRFWRTWFFDRSVQRYLARRPFEYVFSLDRISRFTHLHAGAGTHRAFLKIKNENAPVLERLFRKTSFFHAYLLYLEKKSFLNPDLKKIHCCSQMVSREIHKSYGVPFTKLQVIYNGIDWESIGGSFCRRRQLASDLSQKHRLDLRHDWLLFLGSGFERKGLELAIAGLAFLPSSYHLLVVGQGNTRQFIRQARGHHIATRISFLGPQPEGWRFAALCKAVVLPSHYDPFGLAAAEAQAMGLPALLSERTGYSELVQPGQTGVILKHPMTLDYIRDAFKNLQALIENPQKSADQIRNHIRFLDKSSVLSKLIHDFVGF